MVIGDRLMKGIMKENVYWTCTLTVCPGTLLLPDQVGVTETVPVAGAAVNGGVTGRLARGVRNPIVCVDRSCHVHDREHEHQERGHRHGGFYEGLTRVARPPESRRRGRGSAGTGRHVRHVTARASRPGW
jgi:hypothetical protein